MVSFLMSHNIPQVVPGDTHPSWEWWRSVSLVLKSNLLNPPTLVFLYWYEKTICFVSMFTYSSTLSLHSYSLYIRISVYIYMLLFSCCVVSHSFYDPMDCSLPGSSVYGDLQARILEWVAISSSRRSSWPRDWTRISCIGWWAFYHWATRKALYIYIHTHTYTHTHMYITYII